MPSANKTPNIGLNNWEGNEYVKRRDFIDDNLIIDEKVGQINEQLGDMTQVPTTNKTVEGSITELFTNVDNGKNAISGAITDVDSNVTIPTNPTFGDLASAIGQINTGKKWAMGTFTTSEITVTGLDFIPNFVIVIQDKQMTLEGEAVGGAFKRRGDNKAYSFRSGTENYAVITFYNTEHINYKGFYFSERVTYYNPHIWYAFE